MQLTARDVMVQDFQTIQPDASIDEAVRLIYNGKVRPTGHKTVSTLVTDEFGQLVGILSMFDILYHLRPPVLNYTVDSISFRGEELESYIDRFKGLTVEQVMNAPVRNVSPEIDLMTVIDRMVKERCHRLPVVKNSVVIGVVYLSDVYYHLCKTWLKSEQI